MIAVDTIVLLPPPAAMRVHLPPEGCAAISAQRLLGPHVWPAPAFDTVAAHHPAMLDSYRL
ncbi:MAG: hypothetical protein AB7N70_01145 [Dehalococcoidia bacterium]